MLLIRRLSDAGAGPCGYLLMMTDHERLVTANNVILGLSNVALNFILIAEFGVIGAAAATAASVTVFNFIKVFEVWWFERLVPYSGAFLKPLFAGLVCGGVMILLERLLLLVGLDIGMIRAFVGGIVGVCAYLIILYALGVDEKDKKLVENLYV
ncbi:polysaccharide biosynthesis C-terminal domain-containing protein [Halomicroarcula sp. GCM10025709]|uniref:polysaccharide biosynthesis C-terminal domain-containing protein n=1 Tax=Halomicroarcula sp. GCM10025709 TaxID=3252669 RepID=UPI0036203EE4